MRKSVNKQQAEV